MAYLKKIPPLGPCPFEAVLAIVGGKWKARILRVLADGPRTFGELKRALSGISQQVLSAALKALEADGMIKRAVPEAHPTRSVVSLSDDARELLRAMTSLALWGAARLQRQGLVCPADQMPLECSTSAQTRQPRKMRGRSSSGMVSEARPYARAVCLRSPVPLRPAKARTKLRPVSHV